MTGWHQWLIVLCGQMLPLVDKSLEWCASRYDSDGLFLCHKVRTLTPIN